MKLDVWSVESLEDDVVEFQCRIRVSRHCAPEFLQMMQFYRTLQEAEIEIEEIEL